MKSHMKFAALAGCALILACGGDSTGPTTNIGGTFTLRSINGQSLPYVILQSGQNSASVTADQIIIANGGSWTEQGNYTTVTNGQSANQVISDGGTWVRSGNGLALESSSSGTVAYSGTFTSSELDLTDGTFNFVFTK